MSKIDLLAEAHALTDAWRSRVVGRAADANVKIARMDDAAYPDETHASDEALLALEGQMNLDLQGQRVEVRAGVPHAVARGSHGTLVIIDR
ncbi:cupin [Paracidovorax wautersii]|uniref:cupin n=1 Tax=Paracidovorax wautersii TaxID=1177982 RepID=UPI0031D8AE7A